MIVRCVREVGSLRVTHPEKSSPIKSLISSHLQRWPQRDRSKQWKLAYSMKSVAWLTKKRGRSRRQNTPKLVLYRQGQKAREPPQQSCVRHDHHPIYILVVAFLTLSYECKSQTSSSFQNNQKNLQKSIQDVVHRFLPPPPVRHVLPCHGGTSYYPRERLEIRFRWWHNRVDCFGS